MTRKSFAFLIPLSVMLSVSWSAFAQTPTDKEMLLGTWKLSEIQDDSGDRSGDIDKYLDVGTLTFSEKVGGDTLDMYFSPRRHLSPDDISVTNLLGFKVDEAVDTLRMLAITNEVPSQYVFDSDTQVTFVMDSAVINGFIDGVKPFAPLLGVEHLVPILDELTPYTGTASFTFRKVAGADLLTGKWWNLSDICDDAGCRTENIDRFLDAAALRFHEAANDSSVWDIFFAYGASFNLPPGFSSLLASSIYEINQTKGEFQLLMRPQGKPEFWLPALYDLENDTTMVLTFPTALVDSLVNPLFDNFKQNLAAVAPALAQLPQYDGALVTTFTLFDGDITTITSVDRADELPETSTLAQNYPNPFNPSTEIVYYLDESGPVRLEVFDMAGKLVETLVDSVLPQGEHRARFDAGELPTGTYVYRLAIGNGTQTLAKTMTLVR